MSFIIFTTGNVGRGITIPFKNTRILVSTVCFLAGLVFLIYGLTHKKKEASKDTPEEETEYKEKLYCPKCLESYIMEDNPPDICPKCKEKLVSLEKLSRLKRTDV